MNKLKTLVVVSRYSWIVAIVLMLFSWLRLWSSAFANIKYQIEDSFINIGVLGGWLFIMIFYTSIILFAGWFVLRMINNLEHDVLGRKHDG